MAELVFCPKKLKKRREWMQMSREAAAKRIGCRDEAYRAWEDGTEAPSKPWLERLAQVMECGIGDLLKRKPKGVQ